MTVSQALDAVRAWYETGPGIAYTVGCVLLCYVWKLLNPRIVH
jgi:hypothetical protein